MKYTFHIVDVFSSIPFGGNQLAVGPNAAVGHILLTEKEVFAKN